MRRLRLPRAPRRALLAAAGGLLALPASLATPAHAASADASLADLRIETVEEPWARSGDTVTLGTSVSAGDADVDDLRLTFSTMPPLTTRDEVSAWLEGGTTSGRTEQSRTVIDGVAAGQSAASELGLEVPDTDQPVVLPLVVAVSGVVDGQRELLDVERTVLPVLPPAEGLPGATAASDDATPKVSTRLGWMLGVTGELTDEQFSSDAAERRAAWDEQLAANPSLAAATRLHDRVTPVVDPSLVSHLSEDQSTALFPDGSSESWRLPRQDVDPLTVQGPPEEQERVWERATAAGQGAGPLVVDMSSRTGRLGSTDPRAQERADSLPERSVVLAPAGFRGQEAGSGEGAGQQEGNRWQGHRVGWVDQGISHHLTAQGGQDGDTGGTALPAQALLGLTLVTGDEASPSDLVLLPDPEQVDADALEVALDAVESAPWTTSLSAAALLECPGQGCAGTSPRGTAHWSGIEPEDRLPDLPQEAALHREALQLASAVAGPTEDLLRDTPLALQSDRWRSAAERDRAHQGLHALVEELTGALDVEGSTVNLLADEATLRATIANRTDIPFADLRVSVQPGNYRVSVDQPQEALSLGTDGRASTTFTARAHAAGQVPLRVVVTTPDGQKVLARGEVTVNARPSEGWWYAGLGIVIALFIGFGAWRTVRQVRAAAPSSD